MKNEEYKNAMKGVKPSDETINKILNIVNEEPKPELTVVQPKKKFTKTPAFKTIVGIAACFVLLVGVYAGTDGLKTLKKGDVSNETSQSQTQQAPASTEAAVQPTTSKSDNHGEAPKPTPLKVFSSKKELREYMEENSSYGRDIELYDEYEKSYGVVNSDGIPETAAPAMTTTAHIMTTAPNFNYTQSAAQSDDSVAASPYEPSGNEASTYIQEQGVDEADIIKTQNGYIYYLSHAYTNNGMKNFISIFKTDNGKSEKVGEIKMENDIDYISEMYVSGDRLVVEKTMGEVSGLLYYVYDDVIDVNSDYDDDYDDDDYDYEEDDDFYDADDEEVNGETTTTRLVMTKSTTTVVHTKSNVSSHSVKKIKPEDRIRTITEIYDISNPANPKKLDSFGQSGNYVSSRLIGDRLYLVSSYGNYIYNEITCDEDYIPVLYKNKEHSTMAYDCIAYTPECDGSEYVVTSCVDINKCERIGDAKAVIGAASDVYCSLNNLYIYGSEWDADVDADCVNIIKVNLKETGPEFAETGKVKGNVDSSYSFSEKDGKLLVFTTYTDEVKIDPKKLNTEEYEEYDEWDDIELIDRNILTVLDEKMKTSFVSDTFADDESIRAVKYIGDYAYVITYEETDPLFVFDLSDLNKPKKLGEVKITGFSTMLVDIGNNMLLGIGYGTEDADYTDLEVTNGVKFALFDVSDPLNPKVLDSKEYKNIYSDAQDNPKAFVQNTEKGYYAIPVNNDLETEKIGAIVVAVENGKIVEKINTYYDSNDGWANCRLTFVDDYYYLVSDAETENGIRIYSFELK